MSDKYARREPADPPPEDLRRTRPQPAQPQSAQPQPAQPRSGRPTFGQPPEYPPPYRQTPPTQVPGAAQDQPGDGAGLSQLRAYSPPPQPPGTYLAPGLPAAWRQSAAQPPAESARHPARPRGPRRRLAGVTIGVVCLLGAASTGLGAAAATGETATGNAATGSADRVIPLAAGAERGKRLTQAEIDKVLRRHAKALRDKDKTAYLSLYDQSKSTLIKHQRQRYRNLVKIPFEHVAYKAERQFGRTIDKFDQGIRVTLDVAFVHQIEEVDLRPVFEWYRWTMVVRSGESEPEVTKVRPSPGPDGARAATYHPAPWDVYDRMAVVRKPHALIVSSRRNAAEARRYAGVIERAARRNIRVWKRHAPDSSRAAPGFLVVLESSRKRFTKMYGVRHGRNVRHLAGYARPLLTHRFFSVKEGDKSELTGNEKKALTFGGSRIVIDVTVNVFTELGMRGVRELTRHELAHALIDPMRAIDIEADTRALPRLWILEGFAEYMGTRGQGVGTGTHAEALRYYLRRGRFDGTLPSDRDIRSGSLLEANASYQLASLALRYIVNKYGEDAMFRLVTMHYRNPGNLATQVRRVTGLRMSTFEKRWAGYVRRVAR